MVNTSGPMNPVPLTSTAVFLKEQGRIQELKPDYKAFVTDAYVKKAAAK